MLQVIGPGVSAFEALALFAIGAAVGFLAGSFNRTDDMETRHTVAYIVTLAWLISVAVQIIDRTYETPVPVHAMMGMVIGYLFGKSVVHTIDELTPAQSAAPADRRNENDDDR